MGWSRNALICIYCEHPIKRILQPMDSQELQFVCGLWCDYFPKEVFFTRDPRLTGVVMFRDFFLSEVGRKFIEHVSLTTQRYVYFDVKLLSKKLPFNDFESSLRLRPAEVMGCLGIALSLMGKRMNPYFTESFSVKTRFYGLDNDISFNDLKSSTVGQLVSIKGHVIRVSACRPFVESASFLCAKCMQYTFTNFEDGIFMPPTVCSTAK